MISLIDAHFIGYPQRFRQSIQPNVIPNSNVGQPFALSANWSTSSVGNLS